MSNKSFNSFKSHLYEWRTEVEKRMHKTPIRLLSLSSSLSLFFSRSFSFFLNVTAMQSHNETPTEDARVQENFTSDDLSYIIDYSSQFRDLDGHVADILLRVRGSSLGYRSTGSAMYGVWCQVSRKVQGPLERRLLAEWVTSIYILVSKCNFCVYEI